MIVLKIVLFLSLNFIPKTLSVPPDVCFAKFRWDDCGMNPKPVMYYYQPGSRCEVGLWKGCLPNQNMFFDEYECVRTCIFADRAIDEEYHKQHKADMTEPPEVDPEDEGLTEYDNETSTAGAGNETGGDGGAGNGASNGGGGAGNGDGGTSPGDSDAGTGTTGDQSQNAGGNNPSGPDNGGVTGPATTTGNPTT